jgi:hypothetical protein
MLPGRFFWPLELRLYPFANTFKAGHVLAAELSNGEPRADEHNSLLPPDAFHLTRLVPCDPFDAGVRHERSFLEQRRGAPGGMGKPRTHG